MHFRQLRHFPEILLARLAMAIIPALPRAAVVRLADFLGFAAFLTCNHLRHVGLANLDIAFGPDKTSREKKALLKRSFQTFALVVLDLFWFSRSMKKRIDTFVHLDPSFDVLLSSGCFICISAHLGNWEILGRSVALRGCPLTSIVAPLANRWIDNMFNRIRENTGQKAVQKQGAVRSMMKALRRGEIIAILLDQNTKPTQGGIFVDFFGLPAPISSIAAILAMRYEEAHVMFGSCIPDCEGHYHSTELKRIPLSLPDGLSRTEAERKITEIITDVMKEYILQYPENWLWLYKRWKYIAPGKTRDEYPFYAKELTEQDRQAATRNLF